MNRLDWSPQRTLTLGILYVFDLHITDATLEWAWTPICRYRVKATRWVAAQYTWMIALWYHFRGPPATILQTNKIFLGGEVSRCTATNLRGTSSVQDPASFILVIIGSIYSRCMQVSAIGHGMFKATNPSVYLITLTKASACIGLGFHKANIRIRGGADLLLPWCECRRKPHSLGSYSYMALSWRQIPEIGLYETRHRLLTEHIVKGGSMGSSCCKSSCMA